MKINHQIKTVEVRLVPYNDDRVSEVISLKEALQRADESSMDLICINEKVEPCIVIIADYKKYCYDQKKKVKPVKVERKEIKVFHTIEKKDLERKIGDTVKFLEEGNQVTFILQAKKGHNKTEGRQGYVTNALNSIKNTVLNSIPFEYTNTEEFKLNFNPKKK